MQYEKYTNKIALKDQAEIEVLFNNKTILLSNIYQLSILIKDSKQDHYEMMPNTPRPMGYILINIDININEILYQA